MRRLPTEDPRLQPLSMESARDRADDGLGGDTGDLGLSMALATHAFLLSFLLRFLLGSRPGERTRKGTRKTRKGKKRR